MARFINKGTDKKPNFQVDENESTSPNPYGSAKKALAAKEAETNAEQAQPMKGAK